MPGALDKLGETAQKLVGKMGKTYTLITAEIEPDPDTGISTSTETTQSVVGTPPSPFSAKRMQGVEPQEGDMMVAIAARDLAVTPVIGSSLSFALDGIATRWQIVAVDTLWSGELPALYKLQLRN